MLTPTRRILIILLGKQRDVHLTTVRLPSMTMSCDSAHAPFACILLVASLEEQHKQVSGVCFVVLWQLPRIWDTNAFY